MSVPNIPENPFQSMNSKGLSMINTESTCCAQVAMKANLPVLLASAVILLLTSVATAQPAEKKPVYQDPTLTIRVRVDDLMSRMTQIGRAHV